MAFVVVILLSLTLLIEVESRSSNTQKELLLVRNAAQTALFRALGDLQKHAGPDQRVTTRAEISGVPLPNSTRFWTGVWNTTNTNSEPIWLVSGNNPSPNNVPAPSPQPLGDNYVTISEAYDSENNGDFSSPDDAPSTIVPLQTIDDIQLGWWVIDEGVKAALSPVDGLSQDIDPRNTTDYLDYNQNTLLSNRLQHDPKFDFPDLYDSTLQSSPEEDILRRANELEHIATISRDFVGDEQTRASIEAELLHSITLDSSFVFSNTLEGGLKQDLSFLKTRDLESLTESNLQALYQDPDDLINKQIARLVQFRANPTVIQTDEVIGMQLDAATINEAANEKAQFRLSPVITEFQLSLGVAADDLGQSRSNETVSPVYLVHKLYLELWNPYTVPFLIGDPSMSAERGFSDLRVEVENLPSFVITNEETSQSVSGKIQTLSYKWSDYASRKVMRPGMIFQQTLPQDNYAPSAAGSNKTGVELTDLSLALPGKASDNYSGEFDFTDGPVAITIYAISETGDEVELFKAEIDQYPAFTVDYDPSNRATYFKRRITSEDGQFGMNHNSLETQGYAFAIRTRMLSEQEYPGSIQDISNWLSKSDVRKQKILVDLDKWDINEAWEEPILPYDFRVSFNDTDPGSFDPSESFKPDDFFHYGASSGRQDRIARFIDFPTGEIIEMGALRALEFRDYPMSGISNPWGESLNLLYDRYFFSSLPDPDEAVWDGAAKLANPRVTSHSSTPSLVSPDTAEQLLLSNGFNLNSTSVLAWRKILAGNTIPSSELEARYEQGSFPDPPSFFPVNDSLQRVFLNNPQSATFNLTEESSSPAYELVTRAQESNYVDRFSLNSLDWQNDLQHPAFIQPIRELTEADVGALAAAIVSELKVFYSLNNRPPYSISEYLESGILQQAIDNCPTINSRDGNVDQIPRHTPSSITQATLMNYLGTFTFPRSDTFVIRALAKYTNPITGNTSQAMCEARVQRLPDVHETPQFGRRFHIIEFSWLDEKF